MINIARSFFNFDTFISLNPVGDGHINDTYRLIFEQNGQQKTVLLQRLNHLVFRQPEVVTDNTNRICDYLATQDYPYRIAQPLPGLDGAFLQRDAAGNFWRVFTFLDHTYAPEGLSEPLVAYEAACAYGAFAYALRHFPANTLVETIPGFHDTDRRWAVLLNILETDPAGRVAGTKPEIEALFEFKPIFDKISALKRSGAIPLRVSHNDTKAGNVLFDQNTRKAVAVIDLDTVMPGTILSDFGDMVRTFAPDGPEDAAVLPNIRWEIVEALKKGFLEKTASFLLPAEKEHLMLGAVWMAGEQALRFLTDWLAGDVYYKIKFPEHNLLRCRNQIRLGQVLRGNL